MWQKEVDAFLGVSTRTVGEWMAAYREHGDERPPAGWPR
jgi:transposase